MRTYRIRHKSDGLFYTPDYPYKTKHGKIYSNMGGVKLAIKAAQGSPSKDFRYEEWEVCLYSSEPTHVYQINMKRELEIK